jgi:hypothetical protein
MLRNVVAIERDGLDFRTLTIVFEVPDDAFDLVEAVKKASTEYCQTEEGIATYRYNCHSFNWADFAMSVPNEICEKYGFKKVVDGILSDIEVNWDEELADESQILDKEDDNEEI